MQLSSVPGKETCCNNVYSFHASGNFIVNLLYTEDVDRPCKLACQDQTVPHRFYIVNGEIGWFPFGTDCARGDPDRRAFCLSGKCLVSIQYLTINNCICKNSIGNLSLNRVVTYTRSI